jgi:hypothetical protein
MHKLAFVIVAACSGSSSSSEVAKPPPPAPGSATIAAAPADAAPSRDFVLEIGGTLTTPAGAKPLVHATEVHKGDTVAFAIKTTVRTTVYLAYCDAEQHLAIYPPVGALAAEPDKSLQIPRGDPFVADAHTGLEHFFVIASAGELDRSDPNLQSLIARAQGGNEPCGSELAMSTEESRALGKQPAPVGVDAGAVAAPKPHYAAVPKIWRPRGFELPETASTSQSRSDAAGIAIWAITLAHR